MRPKVLHVTQSTGGVQTSLLLLFRHLDRQRFELHLACPPGTTLAAQARALGVPVFPVAMVRNVSPIRDVLGLVGLWQLMRRERYDIVHAHSAKAGYLGRLAGWLSRTRRVLYAPRAFSYLSQRGMARAFFLALERLARPLTTLVVAASESERERAVREVGFATDRVVTIPNAIDIEAVSSLRGAAMDGPPVVLTVGRLGYQKNPAMFVRVARLVADRHAEASFILSGAGFASPEEAGVRMLAHELRLDNRLTIVPWREHDETLRLIAGCTVFVLTSRFEGMPNTILEAMGLGKPVVATDVDGTRDVVRQGATGFLVPPEADQEMAEAILGLLEAPELARRAGAAGAALVDQAYDIRRTARDVERLYERILMGESNLPSVSTGGPRGHETLLF